MAEFKSGFVSIIGRTNVGKSTLVNTLVGEKVAITANKCQITRTVIRAIINRENSQIIFMDTPGIHKPKTKLGKTMLETVWTSIPNSDVTLYIIDATAKTIGTGDRIILDKIKELKSKTILLINKIDLIKKEDLVKITNSAKVQIILPFYKNGTDYFTLYQPVDLTNQHLSEWKQIIIAK